MYMSSIRRCEHIARTKSKTHTEVSCGKTKSCRRSDYYDNAATTQLTYFPSITADWKSDTHTRFIDATESGEKLPAARVFAHF